MWKFQYQLIDAAGNVSNAITLGSRNSAEAKAVSKRIYTAARRRANVEGMSPPAAIKLIGNNGEVWRWTEADRKAVAVKNRSVPSPFSILVSLYQREMRVIP